MLSFNPIYTTQQHSFPIVEEAKKDISSIFTKKSIKYLSLMGGGLRGISHLGAYQYLVENKLLDELKAVSGSSIGAIFGLVIVCKTDPKLVIDAFKADKTSISISDVISVPYNLLYNWSLIDDTKLKLLVDKIFDICKLPKEITFGNAEQF